MYAIETEGLTKRFKAQAAVSNLDLSVPSCCVYGFLGPNGAGKTTTLRLLLGLLKPTSGKIRLLGHDVASDRIPAMRGVGSLIEMPALYDHLSGRDNIDTTRQLLSLASTETDRVLELVNLAQDANRRAGTYSLGMRQRLALARSLLGNPRLLLLDEPTNGLDPDGIIQIRSLIRDLPDLTGATVFMSSHLLSEVEQTASIVGLMFAGRLLVQDEVTHLINGETATLSFKLRNPSQGAERLKTVGANVTEVVGDTIQIKLQAGDDPQQTASSLNRVLVEAGFDVWHASQERPSLEQVYLRAVASRPVQEAK